MWKIALLILPKMTKFYSHHVAPNQVKAALKMLTPPLSGVGGVSFFEYIFKYVSYIHNFFQRKEQRWRYLLHTLNTIIRPIEKFLEHFEKNFLLKMRDSSEYSSLIFASILTSQYTSLFLPYNPICVPYGYDFFTGIKNYSRRTFQIPSTWS